MDVIGATRMLKTAFEWLISSFTLYSYFKSVVDIVSSPKGKYSSIKIQILSVYPFKDYVAEPGYSSILGYQSMQVNKVKTRSQMEAWK